MRSTPAAPPASGRVVPAAMMAFGLLHLGQLATPLRLNTDAIVYLSLGHSVLLGGDWSFAGSLTRFPAGYPLALGVAEWLGVLTPVTLGIANLACLACGLWCARTLLVRKGAPVATVDLALLLSMGSWVLVKHAPLPLSDLPYMAVSLLALLLLERWAAGGWMARAAAVAMIAAAVSVRYVGLALFPALLWELGRPLSSPARRGWLAASLVLGIGAILLGQSRVAYLQDALGIYAVGGLSEVAFGIARDRLTEWGELLTNLPMARLELARHSLFPLAGALAVGLVGRSRTVAGARISATEVYLLAYACILLAWPYYDPRLWLPVLPFVYTWLLNGMGSGRAGELRRRVYAVVFLVLGLGALAFSLRLSLAGDRFPEHYGDGSLRRAYQVAWGQAARPDDMGPVEGAAVELLLRLEPRARDSAPESR